MRDHSIVCSPEQEAEWLSMWGGVKPVKSEGLVPGCVGKPWDCPTGYFTVNVPILEEDKEMVVHNLCIQMSWYTLESLCRNQGDWAACGVTGMWREWL